ncbi:MAG: hypothetical protein H0U23_02455, partial [Blastocatellia bacterium]|nr:hypothetical protein [Blastocatellia bacterium]
MPRKKKVVRRGWGKGTKTDLGNGKTEIRWMADGKRLKKVVASIEADVWLEKVVEAQPEPASTKAATIHEYATGWFARRSTVDNKGDRLKYEMHLKPLLGHLHPDTV